MPSDPFNYLSLLEPPNLGQVDPMAGVVPPAIQPSEAFEAQRPLEVLCASNPLAFPHSTTASSPESPLAPPTQQDEAVLPNNERQGQR